jgi:hypothetical protein
VGKLFANGNEGMGDSALEFCEDIGVDCDIVECTVWAIDCTVRGDCCVAPTGNDEAGSGRGCGEGDRWRHNGEGDVARAAACINEPAVGTACKADG